MTTEEMLTRFAELESQGLVKIEAKPEEEMHDLSYVDTWGLTPEETKKEKAEIRQTIDSDRLWIYCCYYRKDEEADWILVDSLGDCVGDLDLGYAADLKRNAVEAFDLEGSQEHYQS